jgi:hypothetical protein
VIQETEGIMDTETNQPDQAPAGEPTVPASQAQNVVNTRVRRPRRKFLLMTGTALILIAIAVGWSWWLFGRSVPFNENKNINKDEYQAIFLTNGQVYFGKLANLNNKYVTVTDIYYLQVQQNQGLQGSTSSGDSNSQVSLAKLGSELHGPEDKMYISSDQMLFWENLKGSSKVVQAIDKYQAR